MNNISETFVGIQRSLLNSLVLWFCYTELCCFLFEWDSRDRKHICILKQWPKRELLIPGQIKLSEYSINQR